MVELTSDGWTVPGEGFTVCDACIYVCKPCRMVHAFTFAGILASQP